MDYLPVSVQTLYADLIDRAWSSDYLELFHAGATPYKVKVKGREYWYVRAPYVNGVEGKRIYLGLDTEEVQARIRAREGIQAVRKDRMEMVRALRSARLPVPDPISGKIMSSLAQAGAFRLRAVIVGTAAFQAYAPLLGTRFNATTTRTGDLDIAQFHSIALAVEDEMQEDFLTTLRDVDPNFEAIPSPLDGRRTLRYALKKGNHEVFSVDVLSPLRGPEIRGRITELNALRTDAQLLRYLDFLIYEEVNAVALYGLGIPINVPSPERYAVHKMIVAQMRVQNMQSQAKARKDLRQASELLEFLIEHRPYELKQVWDEALDRGPSWREKLMRSIELIGAERKDALLGL